MGELVHPSNPFYILLFPQQNKERCLCHLDLVRIVSRRQQHVFVSSKLQTRSVDTPSDAKYPLCFLILNIPLLSHILAQKLYHLSENATKHLIDYM